MNYYARYINLDSRSDRNEHMINELSRVGLKAERHRAIPWREVKNIHEERFKKMYQRTPGAIGCFLSQVQVMLDAFDDGKHAFVMEDDLIFCSDFEKRMAMIEDFTTKNRWDAIWLGGTYHRDRPYWHKTMGRDWEPTEDANFVRTYGAFSTHSYIVNKDSIQEIVLGLMDHMKDSIGVDYSFIRMQPHLHTYSFVPGCVKQIDNESNIGTGMTYFSRFNKLGSHWFQNKMEDYINIKHRIELVDLIKKFGLKGPSAELGVAQGLFSRDLLAAGIEFLYMVDLWGHQPGITGDGNFPQEWHDKNYADAVDITAPYTNKALLRCMTVEAAEEFPDETFALVYHDADHSYHGVKKDIEKWWPKIQKGGIMAWHDFESEDYGVNKAVIEFCSANGLDFHRIPEHKLEDAGAFVIKPL